MLNNYKNKKVLITGCDGFKGSWLTYWLINLGAKVTGLSFNNQSNILYKSLQLNKYINHYTIDITKYNKVENLISKNNFDIIFHLAAQSIVSEGYTNPYNTFNTNILGGLNILEALTQNKNTKLIYVTSDKCYKNKNIKRGYFENDDMGGDDPYSLSKAIKELIFLQYKNIYFDDNKFLKISSVRAGNVIGGGDFAKDRIIPDLMKAIFLNDKLIIRNPNSTRPWQHVLEPLYGYMLLGIKLLNNSLSNRLYPSWNFGPIKEDCRSVKYLVENIEKLSNKKIPISNSKKYFMEHIILKLNINKAKKELDWEPKLKLKDSLLLTYDWYNQYYTRKNIKKITLNQISDYELKVK